MSLNNDIRNEILKALEPLVDELVGKAFQKLKISEGDSEKKVKVTIPIKTDTIVDVLPPKKDDHPSTKPKTLKNAVESSEKKKQIKKQDTGEWSCPRIKKGQTEPCGKNKGTNKEIDGKKYCLACSRIVEGTSSKRTKKDPLPPPSQVVDSISRHASTSSTDEKKMTAVASLLTKMNSVKKSVIEPRATILNNGDTVYVDDNGYVYNKKTGVISGKMVADKITQVFDDDDRKYIEQHRIPISSEISYKRAIAQAIDSSGSDNDVNEEDSIDLDLSDDDE